jgi:hypothetical protein
LRACREFNRPIRESFALIREKRPSAYSFARNRASQYKRVRASLIFTPTIIAFSICGGATRRQPAPSPRAIVGGPRAASSVPAETTDRQTKRERFIPVTRMCSEPTPGTINQDKGVARGKYGLEQSPVLRLECRSSQRGSGRISGALPGSTSWERVRSKLSRAAREPRYD